MIVHAEVHGLLGEFNHRIDLGTDSEFVIAYGVNGVGKTKFLELIRAALNCDLSTLAFIPFDYLALVGETGDVLRVGFESGGAAEGGSPRVIYTLHRVRDEVVHWSPDSSISTTDKFYPVEPVAGSGGRFWYDAIDGEVISRAVVEHRFGPAVLRRLDRHLRNYDFDAGPPKEISTFFEMNRVHLIDTQRLYAPPKTSEEKRTSKMFGRSPFQSRVEEYSSEFRELLKEASADHSLSSQRLDNTFPARIMRQSLASPISERDIRDIQREQETKSQRLSDFGLTPAHNPMPLPDRELQPWQRAVLQTYLGDNEQKLATFDLLLRKMTLFEDLLDDRLLHKRVSVHAEFGLRIWNTRTDTFIPASGLSTGEQHQLALLYDLLFRVAPRTLVLIDEPEISMHVGWQKKFLDSVSQISAVSNLRFIIATHSPQIIGKWWSRTVELGPEGADV